MKKVIVHDGADGYDGLNVYDENNNLIDQYSYNPRKPEETDCRILKEIAKDYEIIEYDGITGDKLAQLLQ